MQIQGSDLPINDYLRDDTLLKVTASSPWYANLVNFMVTGYIPLGEDKKRLIHLNRFHLWDDPYLFKVCADGLLRRCVPLCETRGFLSVVNPRLMEDTTEHSVPMQKFGRVVSFGQTCMETPKNSSGVAGDVRSTGISIPEMLCP